MNALNLNSKFCGKVLPHFPLGKHPGRPFWLPQAKKQQHLWEHLYHILPSIQLPDTKKKKIIQKITRSIIFRNIHHCSYNCANTWYNTNLLCMDTDWRIVTWYSWMLSRRSCCCCHFPPKERDLEASLLSNPLTIFLDPWLQLWQKIEIKT